LAVVAEEAATRAVPTTSAGTAPAGERAGRQNLVYGRVGEKNLKLDIYLPTEAARVPWPVVVRIGAKREGLTGVAEALLKNGYGVVNVGYLPDDAEKGVRFGAFPRDVESVKAALRFVRQNAGKYEIDAARMGIIGSGDGATLAAITALSAEGAERVRSVCLLGGTTDFRNAELYGDESVNFPGGAGYQMFGENLKLKPELARAASAINFVRPKSPPVLMVTLHSDGNRAMHLIFAETLKRAGVASALYEQDKGAGLGERNVDEAKLAATIMQFFIETLKVAESVPTVSVEEEIELLANAGLYKQARRLLEEELKGATGERREAVMKQLRAVAVKQQEPAIARLVEVRKNKPLAGNGTGDARVMWTLREVLTDPERIGEYDVEAAIGEAGFDARAAALQMMETLNGLVVQGDWPAADRQVAEMKRRAEATTSDGRGVDRDIVAANLKRYGEIKATAERTWPTELKPLAFVTAHGQDLYGYWFSLRAGGTTQRFRYVAPGKFVMGSGKEEWGRLPGEPMLDEQVVGRGFWISEIEVTQELWEGVLGKGENRSHFRGANLPVENVSYAHAVNFMEKLGVGARLPTEVEWEYACRAGSRFMYGGTGRLSDHAWFWDEKQDAVAADNVRIVHELDADQMGQRRSSHEVRTKLPNAWGIFDMHGNVWEWCKESPGGSAAERPKDFHPLRGGSWISIPQSCRAARAAWFDVEHQSWNAGVRVVIPADPK